MSVSELQRLKHLKDESRRLKQRYAKLSLEHQVLKEVLRKKIAPPTARREVAHYTCERG